jgi:hypothetical protein
VLRLFPKIRNLPPLQRLIDLYTRILTSSNILISRHDHVRILSLSAFTSCPVSLLATTKASSFFFIVCTLPPNILTYKHKSEGDVFHLISRHPGLPEWVGIAQSVGLLDTGWTVRGSIPVRVSFSSSVQTGPGAVPAYYTMGTVSFPGVKWPEHGVDHQPPPSAEVKERVELYIFPPGLT